MTEPTEFPPDAEALLASVAVILQAAGKARELSLIVASRARVEWIQKDWDIDYWRLNLLLRADVFGRLSTHDRAEAETALRAIVTEFSFPSADRLSEVVISPAVVDDPQWRNKATQFLRGDGITNQGRVRSDNLASRECDGLLFRSQPEICLYQALKAQGVAFAPLPVFLKGGPEYRRIEPDFFLIRDGQALVVEVDGDTVHQESPAEAHARLKMLQHEGVHVERILASECDTAEKAKRTAAKIVETLAKYAGR